jgi:hypothetical protein
VGGSRTPVHGGATYKGVGNSLKKEGTGRGSNGSNLGGVQDFMGNRYDSTDLVMAARQKLDHVYQGQESVEKYIERFITLLSDVETEYEICENDKIYMFLKGLNAHIRVC